VHALDLLDILTFRNHQLIMMMKRVLTLKMGSILPLDLLDLLAQKFAQPIEKERGVSLWSMIKINIGKDLTKVCLPVYVNEPFSSLHKCFEDKELKLIPSDRAYEWGKML
jgi:hypothetical protein